MVSGSMIIGGFMRRTRNIFYINGDLSKKTFCYYGMEFSEFIRFEPRNIKNLLLLKSLYDRDYVRNPYYFDLVESQDSLENLQKQDIYNYGDFCFVDYADHSCIESLTSQEAASLLYLAHMKEPLESVFFEKLQNQYAYLAHDDGWFCRLYCREEKDFGEIMCKKIAEAVNGRCRKEPKPVQNDINNCLLQLTERGLLFDLHEVSCHGRYKSLSIYLIGKYEDMDQMYHDMQKKVASADSDGYIEYNGKTWKLKLW